MIAHVDMHFIAHMQLQGQMTSLPDSLPLSSEGLNTPPHPLPRQGSKYQKQSWTWVLVLGEEKPALGVSLSVGPGLTPHQTTGQSAARLGCCDINNPSGHAGHCPASLHLWWLLLSTPTAPGRS